MGIRPARAVDVQVDEAGQYRQAAEPAHRSLRRLARRHHRHDPPSGDLDRGIFQHTLRRHRAAAGQCEGALTGHAVHWLPTFPGS